MFQRLGRCLSKAKSSLTNQCLAVVRAEIRKRTSKTKAVLGLPSINQKESLRMPLSPEVGSKSVGWRSKGVNRPCLVSYFLYSLFFVF